MADKNKTLLTLDRLEQFKGKLLSKETAYKEYENAKMSGVTDVKGALDQLATDVASAKASDVDFEKMATPNTGMAASYKFTKGEKSMVIDIAKDMVVQSGTVETNPSGKTGTFLVLTLANAANDKVYVDVSTLIEYVTSGSAASDKVQIAVDATTHKVTASIKSGSIEKTDLTSALQTEISNKVDKVSGKGLSTNDFEDGYKNKLDEVLRQDGITWNNISLATSDDIQTLQDAIDGINQDEGIVREAQWDGNMGIASAGATIESNTLELFLPFADDTDNHDGGLMSNTQKVKLDGVAAGAQVNVIESLSVNGTAAVMNGKAASVTLPNASSSAAGLMSATDKAALDTLAGYSFATEADINAMFA